MIRALSSSAPAPALHPLFDPAVVREALTAALRQSGHARAEVRGVRVQRYWPAGEHGIALEWSARLDSGAWVTLFGIHGVARAGTAPVASAAALFGNRICGVRAFLPEWDLLIHTADQDAKLPHLGRCMEPQRLTARLHAVWDGPGHGFCRFRRKSGAGAGPPLACRPLSYRAARRAAIAYRLVGDGAGSTRLMGKTYRDDRAGPLLQRHAALNQQLAALTDGRVRVPAPTDHLPELKMALFAWAKGNGPATTGVLRHGRATATAVALSALHRCRMDELKPFTIEQERSILQRWYGVLRTAHPPTADRAEPVLEAVLRAGDRVEAGPARTVHRDFYARQLVQTARTTTILDLDTLAQGNPCVDLGNWLVHDYFDALCVGHHSAGFPSMQAVAVSEYEAAGGPVDRRALAFFCASAAFRVGAVHVMRAGTGSRAQELWNFAAGMAEEVGAPRSGRGRADARNPRTASRAVSAERTADHDCTNSTPRVHVG